jgi:hypothetical protein
MTAEVIIGVLGLVFAVATYFLGARNERRRSGDEERRHRERIEEERRRETDRRNAELVSKVVDEYVHLGRRGLAHGLHALQGLALDRLGSAELIKAALEEMHTRTGKNPLGSYAAQIDDEILLEFFQVVREEHVSFFSVSVEDVVQRAWAKRRKTKTGAG